MAIVWILKPSTEHLCDRIRVGIDDRTAGQCRFVSRQEVADDGLSETHGLDREHSVRADAQLIHDEISTLALAQCFIVGCAMNLDVLQPHAGCAQLLDCTPDMRSPLDGTVAGSVYDDGLGAVTPRWPRGEGPCVYPLSDIVDVGEVW